MEVVICSIEGAGAMAAATEAYLYVDGVTQCVRGIARWHPGHRRIRGGIVLDMHASDRSIAEFGGQQLSLRRSRFEFSFVLSLSLTSFDKFYASRTVFLVKLPEVLHTSNNGSRSAAESSHNCFNLTIT